jgi:hypothetical protein
MYTCLTLVGCRFEAPPSPAALALQRLRYLAKRSSSASCRSSWLLFRCWIPSWRIATHVLSLKNPAMLRLPSRLGGRGALGPCERRPRSEPRSFLGSLVVGSFEGTSGASRGAAFGSGAVAIGTVVTEPRWSGDRFVIRVTPMRGDSKACTRVYTCCQVDMYTCQTATSHS